jgi:hypothetical protein
VKVFDDGSELAQTRKRMLESQQGLLPTQAITLSRGEMKWKSRSGSSLAHSRVSVSARAEYGFSDAEDIDLEDVAVPGWSFHENQN